MEAIIFCGIQGSGKTSFYKQYFFDTHLRISLDQLNTRNKEGKFIDVCVAVHQQFVVDNTNPTRADREKYIRIAKQHKYKVKGYFFQSDLAAAVQRNNLRGGKACIPEIGIRSTWKRLEPPVMEEGFDELYIVELLADQFLIKAWNHEV
jgi:predicted kinase